MTSRSWALVVGFILVCLMGAAGLWLERRDGLPSVVAHKTPGPGIPFSHAPSVPPPPSVATANDAKEAARSPEQRSEPERPSTAANQLAPNGAPASPGGGEASGALPASPTGKPTPSASSPDAGKQAAAGALSPPKPATATASASAGKGEPPPQFDVVRVEPSGDTVLAGRAAPGSKVALLASGKVIAEARADASGGFVMMHPLGPGGYDLTLRQQSGTGKGIVSHQSVAVSVPKHGGGPAMVALAEPGKATRLLSVPEAAPAKVATAPATGADGLGAPIVARHEPETAKSPAKVPKLAFRSVDLENGDGFYATGVAAPDTHIEVYLNNSRIAGVIAAPNGQWSVKVLKGLMGGRYVVRADATAPGREVTARAEVPFDVPDAMGATAPPKPGGQTPTKPSSGETPTVAAGPARGAAGAAPTSLPSSSPLPSSSLSFSPLSSSPLPSSPLPTAEASGGPARRMPPQGQAAATDRAVIQALETARVVSGDNLWHISRTRLGLGHRYTQIYAANAAQIRDPNLIYPDQILVMPHR